MSTVSTHLLKVAHRDSGKLARFLDDFSSGTMLGHCCRDYSVLSGFTPEITPTEHGHYLATIAFVAVNLDVRELGKHAGDGYLIQIGTLGEGHFYTNVFDAGEDECEQRSEVLGGLFFPY